MSEEQEKSGQIQTSREEVPAVAPRGAGLRRLARILSWMGAAALILVLILLGVAHYLNSAGFHERVRQFAVAQVERAIGGRVELQKIEWNLTRLQFEITGLTIHGKEAGTSRCMN
jgi:translocation and assembly module TamB